MNNQINDILMDLCTDLLISRAFGIDNPRICDIVDEFYIVLDGDYCKIVEDIKEELECESSIDRFKEHPRFNAQKAIQAWIEWLNRWCKYAQRY